MSVYIYVKNYLVLVNGFEYVLGMGDVYFDIFVELKNVWGLFF